jgi:sortase A
MSALSATTSWRDRISPSSWSRGLPRVQRVADATPADGPIAVASAALTLVSVVLVVFLAHLTIVSQLEHYTAQHRLYGQLRLSLAEGSTPLGQLDVNGDLVAAGTPIALLDIPELGVHEVVVEGSSSAETKVGVGHRRDSPLPGQAGISVLSGRRAAYGGVFRHLGRLRAGDTFTVRTGQGLADYRVLGVRTSRTPVSPLEDGEGRLTLVTASGRPFQPTGVLRVDAELTSTAFPRPPVATTVVDRPDKALAGDPGSAFALSWLLELLVLVAVGAVWSWKRWGRWPTWIVFAPVLAVTALACADRACDLLPNLI